MTTIRTRLRALILITLVPIAVFGAAGAWLLVQREAETMERSARDRAQALMRAVDTRLQASASALELLARSPALDADDLEAFRAEARRALDARVGEWDNVIVSDPASGTMLLNALVPPGTPLQTPADAATILQSARTLRPTVSQVVVGDVLKRPLFAVRVPVVRDGKAKYVLSAVHDVGTMNRLLDREGLPPGWAGAVLDGNYRFVARYPLSTQGGDIASESLRQALDTQDHGFQRGRLLDGSEIYRAFQRSATSRWSVSIAMPRAVVEQAQSGVWLLVAGVVGAAAVGLWIAWSMASRLSGSIAALAAAAPALGRGEAVALPTDKTVDEVAGLAAALGEASASIRDREERQRAAEQALRAADRAKDEFLAMLGHELRNPLASLSNAAEILKRSHDGRDGVTHILARQVETMRRLVDDLLDVGRVTGGKIRLDPAPLDLGALVRELLETWEHGGRFAHHHVHAAIDDAWIAGDRARIQQVVANLLDNAVKYTPRGGSIRVAVQRHDGRVALEVSDDGDGMPPELIDRMFDLFVQGERGLAREGGGLGIGLTMAKRLVELHGGTIRAASDGVGHGATFRIDLPAIEAPLAGESPVVASNGSAQARRVVVIEDNDDARESLATLLRALGHEVAVAPGGARGIEVVESSAPDIVLIDIGLPDLDGYAVARRLRAGASTREATLVALTGYGAPDDRERALAAGFDAHVTKPVGLDALESILSGQEER